MNFIKETIQRFLNNSLTKSLNLKLIEDRCSFSIHYHAISLW